jgi:putative nucleotidyltransferase with HDIG domain
MESARTRWSRLSVGHKVVAPFVVLTLVGGLLVSAVATQQLATSGAQQLETLAVREQDNVDTVFNSVEESELSDLRLLAATDGVAAAVNAGDTSALSRLMLPVAANHLPERVEVAVVNAKGDGVLELQADPRDPARCVCTAGGGRASFDHLDDVLNGRADSYGTRYEGLVASGSSWLLYTIGPIVDADGQLAGAVLVGEPLDQIAAAVESRAHVQLSLFTTRGDELVHTQNVGFPIPALSENERVQVVQDSGIPFKRVSANHHQAAIYYVPWIVRFEPAGYAALVVPADPVVSAETLVLGVLVIVSLCALALTVLVASTINRSITRPMHELIHATTQVAAGNLHHRAVVDSGDEIGHLAASFNDMTSVLLERTQRLEKLSDETIVTLAATIDARDPYTHGHSMRVAMYADALAAAYGYCDANRELIKQGCMVHDIGKIGVPDDILRKAGPLDAAEWAEMRQHPIVGHRLVSGLPWDRVVFEIILHHHERWDGTGYPAGLTGTAIPHAARVVAIADALDAMTSRRPYRPAHTFRRAADEIVANAGIQFDSELVAIFKAHRRRLAPIVEGALQVWVPRVHRSRRTGLAGGERRLEVVS